MTTSAQQDVRYWLTDKGWAATDPQPTDETED